MRLGGGSSPVSVMTVKASLGGDSGRSGSSTMRGTASATPSPAPLASGALSPARADSEVSMQAAPLLATVKVTRSDGKAGSMGT